MQEKVLITSALLYANGGLHFGHLAGAFLPADCYARFSRLNGDDVLFISGSDEYGVAVTLSAELVGRTPKEQVDYFHLMNQGLMKKMGISFDQYSRTTCKEHAPLSQEFFSQLLKNNYIEEMITPQLFSVEEDRFLADRYVFGECPKCGFKEARGDECTQCAGSYEATDLINPLSKITKSKLELRESNHWYLRLDLFKDQLLKWLDGLDWKPNVLNFIRPYIEDLRPRAITRDAKWGVELPLPDTDGKVLYVWFDAPIGYISASQDWANRQGTPDRWKDYWLDPDTKYVQFIGKDNIVFHAMFFPVMLMGQDIPYKIVNELPANEFLKLEGKQFSKSTGWYIDLQDFLEKYSVDTLRYTLMANAPESQDSEFTWADFQMRVNSELVGKFGNLIHRVLSFLVSKMDGKIPESHHYTDRENEFLENIQNLSKDMHTHLMKFKVRKASQILMEIASCGNAYFDQSKPWELIRDKERTEELNSVMYCLLSTIKMLAIVSAPIIPETADKIWKMLGFKTHVESLNWHTALSEDLVPGVQLEKPKLLFEKIEDERVEEERAKLEAASAVEDRSFEPLKEETTFDDFLKLDLRVASVLSVEKVPKSSKLLKFSVDMGFERRTIVSGIAKHYDDIEQLVGKNVVVVANLKSAKLMGIESQGMILAANGDKFLELPMLQGAKPGMRVN